MLVVRVGEPEKHLGQKQVNKADSAWSILQEDHHRGCCSEAVRSGPDGPLAGTRNVAESTCVRQREEQV